MNINPHESAPTIELSGPFKRIMTLIEKLVDEFNKAEFEDARPKPADVEAVYHALHLDVAALFCFYQSMVATGHMDDRWLNTKLNKEDL